MADSKMKNHIFDSATLYYGTFDLTKPDELLNSLADKKLGTSNNGVTLKLGNEIYNSPIANSNEKNIAGYQRIIRVEAEIEAEIIVADTTLLEMSLFKQDTTTATKYNKYVPTLGEIPIESYKTLLMVAKKGNESWIVIFDKTYNSNGLELETKDGEDAIAKVVFQACYDADNFEAEPVQIFIPKAVAPVV